MTSQANATPSSLVHSLEWEIEEIYNCCKGTMLMRLRAGYTSQVEVNRLVKQGCKRAESTVHNFNNLDFAERLRWETDDPAFAIPLETAYAAVIQDMLGAYQGPLWMATDRIRNFADQDVHLGPFSVRSIVRWMEREDLAKVTQGPTASGVTGWIFTLKKGKCRAFVASKVREYKEFVSGLPDEEVNSDTPDDPFHNSINRQPGCFSDCF